MKKHVLCVILILLASRVFATISYQQSAAMWNQMGTTSCVVPFGAGTVSNNLIVVWTSWQATSTFTASVADVPALNNTFYSAVGPTVQSATGTPTTAQVFYAKKINGGSDTVTVTYTGTGTVSSANCVILEYSGADLTNPLDSASAGYSTSGNMTALLDSGTVAPANSNLLVFGAGYGSPNVGMSAGSGFTSHQTQHGTWGTGIVEDNTTAISGNNVLQRATACIGGSSCSIGGTAGNWLMQMAVFRDASWTVSGGWSPARYAAAQPQYDDQFPGIDIGDKINKATAALPTKGANSYPYGTIYLSSGPYSFSTPIVINGPYVILNCNGATINYTGTGTGLLFSNSANIYDGVGGIEHCYITASGAPTNIVEFNGNVFGHIWDSHIETAVANTGLATNCLQVQNTNLFFTEQLDLNELHVQSCTVGILESNSGGTNSMAYQRWRHVAISTPNCYPTACSPAPTGVKLNGVGWGGGNVIEFSCALGNGSICLWLTNTAEVTLAPLDISGEPESCGASACTPTAGIKVDSGSVLETAWTERWNTNISVNDIFNGTVIPFAWNTPSYAQVRKDPAGLSIGYLGNDNRVLLNTQNLTTNRTQYFQDASGTISLLAMEDCGSTTTCAGTIEPNPFLVRGSVTFPTTTTVSVGSLPFSNSASYSCTASEVTSPAGIVHATSYSSGSSVTFTETGGSTIDTIRYICVGY